MTHFIDIVDHPRDFLEHVLTVGRALRTQREDGTTNAPLLAGKSLAMIFEKPSLRTRVSFQQAMYELGGNAIVLHQHEIGLGKRESIADVTRVLCGMVHGIMARVFEHDKLRRMAEHATVPVINALSDYSHPCQALADVMTIQDAFGEDLSGRSIAFVGDGNNVSRSLARLAGRLDMNFTLAAPEGYTLETDLFEQLATDNPRVVARQIEDPIEAVRDADVIVTDTFVSMGQEDEKEKRLPIFKPYQVNDELLSKAPDHAIVLHCLPAYRGVEITDAVMDGPRSRVFDEAHNRLHAQKGLLAVLMGGA